MQDDTFNKQDKEILSIGEASKFLNVSIDTLRRWEKKGKATAHRSSGGHRYFNKSELQNLFGKRYGRYKNEAANNAISKETEVNRFETKTAADTTTSTAKFTENINWQEVHHLTDPPPHPIPTSLSTGNNPLQETVDTQVKPFDNSSLSFDTESQKEKPQSTDILSPTPSPYKNPETHIASSISTKKSKLPSRKAQSSEGLTSFQKFLIGAFIAFLIIDMVLLFLWQYTRNLKTPVPRGSFTQSIRLTP